jgi:alkylation response protein AidB-like acyl-CoA dehydrogenase
MAHGCASSAWTLGFYALHNWMLALFSEQAQSEAFATRPFLAPAPLAPTGRGIGCDGGIRLSGRWRWATGVMDGNWIIVAALCEREPGDPSTIYPVLALLPMDSARIDDEFVPAHRLVAVSDINTGTTPGSSLHDADTYRWPMVRALALLAAMPALGSAERTADIYTERLSQRFLAYEGVMQKDKPVAAVQSRAGAGTAPVFGRTAGRHRGEIATIAVSGDPVARPVRGQARLAAAHILHESRAVIGDPLGASGASAHFLDNPLQRIKRDVDVISGHVRLRHQPRACRSTDNRDADPPHRDAVTHRREFRCPVSATA